MFVSPLFISHIIWLHIWTRSIFLFLFFPLVNVIWATSVQYTSKCYLSRLVNAVYIIVMISLGLKESWLSMLFGEVSEKALVCFEIIGSGSPPCLFVIKKVVWYDLENSHSKKQKTPSSYACMFLLNFLFVSWQFSSLWVFSFRKTAGNPALHRSDDAGVSWRIRRRGKYEN